MDKATSHPPPSRSRLSHPSVTMPGVNNILFDPSFELVDTDVWAEACLACDSTDNQGNGLCGLCDD